MPRNNDEGEKKKRIPVMNHYLDIGMHLYGSKIQYGIVLWMHWSLCPLFLLCESTFWTCWVCCFRKSCVITLPLDNKHWVVLLPLTTSEYKLSYLSKNVNFAHQIEIQSLKSLQETCFPDVSFSLRCSAHSSCSFSYLFLHLASKSWRLQGLEMTKCTSLSSES